MAEDKEPNHDFTLEEKIISELELTPTEKKGARKFMKALQPFNTPELTQEEVDSTTDFLPQHYYKGLTESENATLMSRVAEYLNSYVIVGYDMRGQRVCNWSFSSSMAVDATLTHLQEVTEICRDMTEGAMPTEDD